MTDPTTDHPLSEKENILLLVAATGTMLGFYLFAITSIVVLLVTVVCELLFMIATSTLGFWLVILPLVRAHLPLLLAFGRSMKLGKAREFRAPLDLAANPNFSSMLSRVCQNTGVTHPNKILVEMGVNAWVITRGLKRGSGPTTLGIGYDLLAGLTQAEFEGVLAHEMMHSKLVERGFRSLLMQGLGRANKLCSVLFMQLAAGRRAKRVQILVPILFEISVWLTRRAARQIAACSRQDEFAADRGAAKVAGVAAIRSSLLKLDNINRVASRLSPAERIAQIESGLGFSEWLTRHLGSVLVTEEAEIKTEAFNQFSTHPSLTDRLAALSKFPDLPLQESGPAVQLLARPDEVAAALVKSMQASAVADEQADSKRLYRLSRRGVRRSHISPLQSIGVLICIVTPIAGAITLLFHAWSGAFVIIIGLTLGISLFQLGKYRDKIPLPIPDYSTIRTASTRKSDVKPEDVLQLEQELQNSVFHERVRSKREAFLVKNCYAALESCDYVRAHVAARLCLDLNNKSVPAALGMAVAAAGIRQAAQATHAIGFVRHRTSLSGKSLPWGVGWALILLGDWLHAEAFLARAQSLQPDRPTIMVLLAFCQARRGKLLAAIDWARKAVALQPENHDYAKVLIEILLQAGFLREANQRLSELQDVTNTDPDLMASMMKASLMSNKISEAHHWAERVAASNGSPQKFVKLGLAYESYRQDTKASEFFHRALQSGYYPEAMAGLGRLEIHQRNLAQAKVHLMTALNLDLPVGEGGTKPTELVLPILAQLRFLNSAEPGCHAWIAEMSKLMKPAALANVILLLYAPNQDKAQAFLDEAIAAMQPDQPPPVPGAVTLKKAPRPYQPVTPVRPGIQGLFN